MKMKNKILIIIAMLLVIPFTVQAEENITKESLTESYKNLLACQKDGNHTERTITKVEEDGTKTTETITECNETMDYTGINMDEYINDTTIFLDLDDNNKMPVNYTIQDNQDVLFEISNTVDNTTTYEQYQSISSESLALISLYPIVAGAKGIKYYISTSYIGGILMDEMFNSVNGILSGNTTSQYVVIKDDADYQGNETVIRESEFPNYAIEYAKAEIGEQEKSFADSTKLDTFALTTTPDVSDPTKYVLSTKFLVKSSKDLSALNSTINEDIIDDEASNNSLDPEEEVVEEQQPAPANPKTGYFLSIIPIAILTIIGLMIIIKRKNYFNKI